MMGMKERAIWEDFIKKKDWQVLRSGWRFEKQAAELGMGYSWNFILG